MPASFPLSLQYRRVRAKPSSLLRRFWQPCPGQKGNDGPHSLAMRSGERIVATSRAIRSASSPRAVILSRCAWNMA
eukprot:scaffold6230_cov127-Isochrysis_galbana.AAC.7